MIAMGNANKIVIAVVIVLAVIMLAFALGSGSCGSSGAGGGATAPVASEASSASSGSGSVSGSSSAASASSADEDYDQLYESLMAQLSQGTGPVGANARDASGAADVLTASAVVADLAQRGFENVELTASFDASGTYLGNAKIDSLSNEKYPSYNISYESPSGVSWQIVVNGASHLAVPIAATGVSLPKEIIVTESDTVTQYDGIRNQYSEFTFSEIAAEGAVGVKVGRVDKMTLDSYTPAALARM